MAYFAPSSGAVGAGDGGGAKFSLEKEGRSYLRDPRADDIVPPIGLRFDPIFSTGRFGTVTPCAASRFCSNAGLKYCQPDQDEKHPHYPVGGSFQCYGKCNPVSGQGEGSSITISTTFLPRNGNVPYPYDVVHFDESQNGSSLRVHHRYFGRSDVFDDGVASSAWIGLDGAGELLMSNPARLPRMNHVGWNPEYGRCGPSFTSNH